MKYTVIYEKGDSTRGAYVPDLTGVIAAGDSREEVESLIHEAVEFHTRHPGQNSTRPRLPTVLPSSPNQKDWTASPGHVESKLQQNGEGNGDALGAARLVRRATAAQSPVSFATLRVLSCHPKHKRNPAGV